jgi:hypothetical protein
MAWPSIGAAMKSLKTSRQHWVCKQATRCCGINSVLVRWKQKESPACPRCGEFETTTHIFRCQHPEVKLLWAHSLQLLDTWLTDNHTDPKLQLSLITNLHQWYQGIPFPNDRTTWEKTQDSAGWDFLLEGCFVSTWADSQQQYFTIMGRKSSGKRWLTSLIKKLLDIAWDLWEHRNGIEHINDRASLEIKLNEKIEEEIRQGFQNLPQHKYGDLYSSRELEHVLIASTEYKRCWLQHIEKARQREVLHQGPQQTQMRRLMRNFLGLST